MRKKISLEKILSKFIDQEVDWEAHLRELRQKGISGDELRRRVGFCISMCLGKDIDTSKKVSTLTRANKWPGYREEEWEEKLVELEDTYSRIIDTSLKLKDIQYYSPADIKREPLTAQLYNWFILNQDMQEDQVISIIQLYGEHVLSAFLNDTKQRSNQSSMQFLFSLHRWLNEQDINPITVKQMELESIQNTPWQIKN
jgi:hypothetical protein